METCRWILFQALGVLTSQCINEADTMVRLPMACSSDFDVITRCTEALHRLGDTLIIASISSQASLVPGIHHCPYGCNVTRATLHTRSLKTRPPENRHMPPLLSLDAVCLRFQLDPFSVLGASL